MRHLSAIFYSSIPMSTRETWTKACNNSIRCFFISRHYKRLLVAHKGISTAEKSNHEKEENKVQQIIPKYGGLTLSLCMRNDSAIRRGKISLKIPGGGVLDLNLYGDVPTKKNFFTLLQNFCLQMIPCSRSNR